MPPTPTRAPAKGNIASYWPQRPPGPVATSPGRHSPGEASPPGLRQRWEADCPPPLRSVRVSVPPALSQSTDTASQAGFALLSQQSQDWLTGSGVTATAPPRDVSPPPLTHTKKRKPADDIMSNVLATKLRNCTRCRPRGGCGVHVTQMSLMCVCLCLCPSSQSTSTLPSRALALWQRPMVRPPFPTVGLFVAVCLRDCTGQS